MQFGEIFLCKAAMSRSLGTNERTAQSVMSSHGWILDLCQMPSFVLWRPSVVIGARGGPAIVCVCVCVLDIKWLGVMAQLACCIRHWLVRRRPGAQKAPKTERRRRRLMARHPKLPLHEWHGDNKIKILGKKTTLTPQTPVVCRMAFPTAGRMIYSLWNLLLWIKYESKTIFRVLIA